jgi:hypothetical protein
MTWWIRFNYTRSYSRQGICLDTPWFLLRIYPPIRPTWTFWRKKRGRWVVRDRPSAVNDPEKQTVWWVYDTLKGRYETGDGFWSHTKAKTQAAFYNHNYTETGLPQ